MRVRDNTPNDIIYIEFGQVPLIAMITARQYIFWSDLYKSVRDQPDSSISKLIKLGLESNLPYLKHYSKLLTDYNSQSDIYRKLNSAFLDKTRDNLRAGMNLDPYGKLGTFTRITPDLEAPLYRTTNLYKISYV